MDGWIDKTIFYGFKQSDEIVCCIKISNAQTEYENILSKSRISQSQCHSILSMLVMHNCNRFGYANDWNDMNGIVGNGIIC